VDRSHYCEEFAEAHGKAMVVRDAIGAALPAAGVGCAFAQTMLARVAHYRRAMPGGSPFAADSLTEDYELGIGIKALGGRSRFLRMRGEDGQLVATRACFPDRLDDAVRQKARWVHGIALQGWDRIGWPGLEASGRWVDAWMQLRDRRSLLSAVVLLAAYGLLILSTLLALTGRAAPVVEQIEGDRLLRMLLTVNAGFFVWRVASRFAFTAREYGGWEGVRAVLRIPLTNVIAIVAARRALLAYCRTLRGARLTWDKTTHRQLPPSLFLERRA
jgi:adsorption protein B